MKKNKNTLDGVRDNETRHQLVLVTFVCIILIPSAYFSINSIYHSRLAMIRQNTIYAWLRENMGNDVLVVMKHLSVDMLYFRIFGDIAYERVYLNGDPKYKHSWGYWYESGRTRVVCVSYLLDSPIFEEIIESHEEAYLILHEKDLKHSRIVQISRNYNLILRTQADDQLLYELI